MIVMKFGGTSVGNADRITHTVDIIKSYAGKKPVIVVSAVGGITDRLIELANAAKGKRKEILEAIRKIHNDIINELGLDESILEEDFKELDNLINNNKTVDAEILDQFQTFGERMSSKIVAMQLNKMGVTAQAFNAWDLGFATTDEFGNAEPLEETFSNLNNNIKKLNVVPVITGFMGKTKNGEIATLGRGGSDYTAAIIGNAVDADEIQIWTDVDGIMSTDPKIVSNAMPLEEVSFAEASELAYFGAKVLHPKTIIPAMKKNIPVRVLNSFSLKNKGTVILNKVAKSKHVVKAITYKKNIIVVNIVSTRMLGAYGFLARIFNTFDKYKKSVDVVSTSEVSVSLTIDNENNLASIIDEMKDIAIIHVSKGKAIISVVGGGMRNTPGLAGRRFGVLGDNKINVEMISQGASGINTTLVVDGKDVVNAVKCLHEEYFGC